jgi:hypothetical protein
MKAKYVGDYYKVVLKKGKVYDILSIENGWYCIVNELGEESLFPPDVFELTA